MNLPTGHGEELPKVPDGLVPHSQNGLIAERAVARGVEVEAISRGLIRLSHGGRSYRFRSGWTTFNNPLARRCTRQKEVTSRLLREQDVPAPESVLFRGDDLRRAWAWAAEILPVVVKPHAANKGTLVHVGVADHASFVRAFEAVAQQFGDVLVEELVAGEEHRFAVVDGRVVAITERVPPSVIGDGVSSVAALVEAKNAARSTSGNPLHKEPIAIDDAVVATLQSQGLTLDAVPPSARTVWLRRTSNISLGGDAVDRTDTVARRHIDLVERASEAIPGLRMGGFDVLLPANGDGAGVILEVNPNPMFSMHHFPWEGEPRDVYSRVLDAMFPATAR